MKAVVVGATLSVKQSVGGGGDDESILTQCSLVK